MSTIPQEEFTRVFERIGGALSGLKRYEDAADLIGGTAYFLFTKRDEFAFFPNVKVAFEKLTNLLRNTNKGYDGADDILKIEITDIGPGTSYDLKIVDAFGGTTLASVTGGAYGPEVPIVTAVAFGPSGKIRVTAPTGTPGADQEIEIRVVASAVRLTTDPVGETEAEKLIEAAALESHQITASNFRTTLLEAALDRVVIDRLFRKFVGAFLGSDTQEIFVEEQSVDGNGNVAAASSGLLVELEVQMRVNTPVQSVTRLNFEVQSTVFDSPGGNVNPGVLTIIDRQALAGTLVLKCTKGFTGSNPDPEEFSVSHNMTVLSRKVSSAFVLRPFRSFIWPVGGFSLSVTRKTLDNDPNTRMTLEKITGATPSNMPLQRLDVRTFKDAASILPSLFEIIEPSTGNAIFTNIEAAGAEPLPAGPKDIFFFGEHRFEFTWAGGSPNGTVTFQVEIFPYLIGDTFVVDITQGTSGRLQVELRKHFDFAFVQTGSPGTIPDKVVATDLPFVEPKLGA